MKKIEMYKDRIRYEFDYADVVYIRAKLGDTQYLVNDEFYRNDLSLNKLEKILEGRCFFRISRDYIVNLSKIRYTKGDTRVFIGGNAINISRRRKKAFEMAYEEYMQLVKKFE